MAGGEAASSRAHSPALDRWETCEVTGYAAIQLASGPCMGWLLLASGATGPRATVSTLDPLTCSAIAAASRTLKATLIDFVPVAWWDYHLILWW
jgi:hypothetical protein